MTHHTSSSTIAIICCLCAFLSGAAMGETAGTTELEAYNVVWMDAPSKSSAESMPCGGGDIGLNVWVEDGEVLFYMQHSGSLAETNEYLKLGRVRLRLDPNPFGAPTGQPSTKARRSDPTLKQPSSRSKPSA